MDFDKIVDRRHTDCVKHDGMTEFFGRDDLIPLWVADMDFEVCPAITEALRHRLEHPVYGYAVTPDSYWQSIVDWAESRHHLEVAKDEITFVPGIVRGLALALLALTDEGDKIIIQQPVYHPFRHIIEGNRRKVVNNPLRIAADGSATIDIALLERQIEEEKPRMLMLCNPHNPGGFVWSRETLEEVAEVCARHGVIVASDEIHGDLELFGNRYTPFLSVSDAAREIGISFAAPSKTFNIAGIVSSWCAVKNPSLRRRFFTWLTVNEFNSPTFVQTIATEAAYRHGSAWLDEAIAYIEGNILFVEQYLGSRIPDIKPVRPQASFLVWLDCTALGLEGRELTSLFVDGAHLGLNDGEIFGPGGERHMRLNVGCPRSVLKQAMEQLEQAVNRYKEQKTK